VIALKGDSYRIKHRDRGRVPGINHRRMNTRVNFRPPLTAFDTRALSTNSDVSVVGVAEDYD
jgi:hypothetical protein